MIQRSLPTLLLLLSASLFACDSASDGGADGAVQDTWGQDTQGGDGLTLSDTGSAGDTDESGGDAADRDTQHLDAIELDSAGAADTGQPSTLAVACPESAAAGGVIYRDLNRSSTSHWAQNSGDPNDEGASGLAVSLLSPDGAGLQIDTIFTCPDGRFGWSDLAAGSHIITPHLAGAQTTTENVAVRFPEAAREGSVVVVTFGDSIPRYGPPPFFPSQLAELIAPIATVDNRNIAIPGSTSAEWMPNTSYFRRLEDELPDADVVVFSIGGNDMQQLADLFQGGQFDVAELVSRATTLVDQVRSRLVAIAEAVHQRAPDADIVWILYPNYTYSDQWADLLGSYTALAQQLLAGVLESMRSDMAALEGVLIADMMSAVPNDLLSELLWDQVHLNEAGHAFFAERIFELLGGVRVGSSPLGLEHNVGLAP